MSVENNASENGHKAPVEKVYTLELKWYSETGAITVEGIANGAVVNLGMLEYALVMVKREDLRMQLKHAQQESLGRVTL